MSTLASSNSPHRRWNAVVAHLEALECLVNHPLILHGCLPNHRAELGDGLVVDVVFMEGALLLLPCLLDKRVVHLEPRATHLGVLVEHGQHVDRSNSLRNAWQPKMDPMMAFTLSGTSIFYVWSSFAAAVALASARLATARPLKALRLAATMSCRA